MKLDIERLYYFGITSLALISVATFLAWAGAHAYANARDRLQRTEPADCTRLQ